MKSRLIRTLLCLILTLALGASPVLAADDLWHQAKEEAVRTAQTEMERFRTENQLSVSDGFDDQLTGVKAEIASDADASWREVLDSLSGLLNQSLAASGPELRAQLILAAQDYNSSRSNKPSTRAQDYNSSRSNKPAARVFDGDPDADGDGLLDGTESIELSATISGDNLTPLAPLLAAAPTLASTNDEADALLAIVFSDALQTALQNSGQLSVCEQNDRGVALFSRTEDDANRFVLQPAFFLPFGIGGGDCDDDDPLVKPGESASDDASATIVLQLDRTSATRDGADVALDVAPYIRNERTMVPFRFIGEQLGAAIRWDAGERSIEYRLGDDVLVLQLDGNTALLNGAPITLDDDPTVTPVLKDGRTLVPVRVISETLGFNVIWNAQTREITVRSENPLHQEEAQSQESPLFEG